MDQGRLAVAYCRVSTLEQQKNGHGIEIQVRDVTLFAQSQGLFIACFYRDEGESGVKENRKALRRLLRDCRAGKISTVVIPSLDRLSRDVRLAENLFWQFEQLRVAVMIADMPTYNGQDRKDVLIRQIREAIAEENRKDIIERLLKGRQERARSGHLPGGNLPYGYRRNGHGPEIDPAEASTVRLIFCLTDQGLGRSEVARAVNERGFRLRSGGLWTPRQVLSVLRRHPLYKDGLIQYGNVVGTNKELILLTEEEKPDMRTAL